MRHCPECGGEIGRDCFNPVECAMIGEAQRAEEHFRSQQAEHPSQSEELEADLTRHKAALKVAKSALMESGSTIATLRKLTPEKARPSILMPDGSEVTHREMCDITQDQIVAALAAITKELSP